MKDLFFFEEVTNQILWNFEFGSQESTIVLIWIAVRFQQQDGQILQHLKNDSFCRLPVNGAQCTIGTKFILMQAYY